MKKRFLEIGKIVSTHGVRGELQVLPWCDGPDFFQQFSTLYQDEQGRKPVRVEQCRWHKNRILLKLAGVDTMDAAQALQNQVLYMDRQDAKLAEGCYFIQDLVGLQVLDADSGEAYGELTEVLPTGANDVYVVKPAEGKDILIPAIPDVVAETDIEGGVLRIRPLEGLIDHAD